MPPIFNATIVNHRLQYVQNESAHTSGEFSNLIYIYLVMRSVPQFIY